MKTKEILNKYKKILCPILNCKEEELKFFVTKRGSTPEEKRIVDEISSLTYEKSNDWSLGEYTVKVNDKRVAEWELYEMHHCCAIMVSCKAYVEKEFRNKGIGTILNNLRQDLGRHLGYSMILCTDIEQNVYQRKLLKTNGWQDIHSVVNKRTKNRVYISVINI